MREIVRKYKDKETIQRFAKALKKNHTVVLGADIYEPISYRVFPDGVEFKSRVMGNVGTTGFQRKVNTPPPAR